MRVGRCERGGLPSAGIVKRNDWGQKQTRTVRHTINTCIIFPAYLNSQALDSWACRFLQARYKQALLLFRQEVEALVADFALQASRVFHSLAALHLANQLPLHLGTCSYRLDDDTTKIQMTKSMSRF